MASKDGLGEDAKKLLKMRMAGAQRSTESAKAVKKADPQKATQKPAQKMTDQPKKDMEKMATDFTEEDVAPPKAKVKAAKVPKEPVPDMYGVTGKEPQGVLRRINQKIAEQDALPMPSSGLKDSNWQKSVGDIYREAWAEHRAEKKPAIYDPREDAEVLQENLRAKGEYPPKFDKARLGMNQLEEDLPKGGGKGVMRVAEDLGETALPKAEGILAKGVGIAKKGLSIGSPVGLGLTALMEGLNAEEANPGMHDQMAEQAAGKEAMMHGVAPRSQLQSELPSEMKAPQQRKLRADEYGVEGPSPQQKMEDEFAKQMARYPR